MARQEMLAAVLALGLTGAPVAAEPAVEGLVSVTSAFPAAETADRLESAAKARGLTIFARIDHAAGAAAVGQELRPTTLLILGNARGGTPLMQQAQTIGIDLPLRALVWQDEKGVVRISYDDPAWLARRHGLDPRGAVPGTLGGILAQLAESAAH
jgi:uncharacterized protein (DUF302 family)